MSNIIPESIQINSRPKWEWEALCRTPEEHLLHPLWLLMLVPPHHKILAEWAMRTLLELKLQICLCPENQITLFVPLIFNLSHLRWNLTQCNKGLCFSYCSLTILESELWYKWYFTYLSGAHFSNRGMRIPACLLDFSCSAAAVNCVTIL